VQRLLTNTTNLINTEQLHIGNETDSIDEMMTELEELQQTIQLLTNATGQFVRQLLHACSVQFSFGHLLLAYLTVDGCHESADLYVSGFQWNPLDKL